MKRKTRPRWKECRLLIVGTAIPALALSACATTAEPIFTYQGEFSLERVFSGELHLGFERQSLNECYLDLRGSAMADLWRLAPSPAISDQTASYSAEVTLVGRRRNVINMSREGPEGRGFGHLGMYPCLIEATQITTARLLSG